jgi:hypothetical protein
VSAPFVHRRRVKPYLVPARRDTPTAGLMGAR